MTWHDPTIIKNLVYLQSPDHSVAKPAWSMLDVKAMVVLLERGGRVSEELFSRTQSGSGKLLRNASNSL